MNNKRKYGNDKFKSGPLSDQPDINTGLLPGSQEIYVESNVDNSSTFAFLKNVPNWIKWLLVALLLLLAFWIWNNRSNDQQVVSIDSTTTTIESTTTTTTTIPNPLDPDYFEPHMQRYQKFLEEMRESQWQYIAGSKSGNKVVDDFSDTQLLALAHDVCDMSYLGYSSQRIIDYLVGTQINYTDYDQFMPFLYHQATTFICR